MYERIVDSPTELSHVILSCVYEHVLRVHPLAAMSRTGVYELGTFVPMMNVCSCTNHGTVSIDGD